ncbi:MAG: hypothetical protein WCK89_16540 [bacterium]
MCGVTGLKRVCGALRYGLAAVFLAAGLGAAVCLAGDFVTLPVGPGGAALTNSQQNSVWSPTAVLMRFDTAPTGSVTVARISAGHEFLLSATDVCSSNMLWYADQSFYFKFGDILRVNADGCSGVVQVMMKAGE